MADTGQAREDVPRFVGFPQSVFDSARESERKRHVMRMIKHGDRKEADRIVRRHWVDRLCGISREDIFYQHNRGPDGLFKDPGRYDPLLI